MKQTLLCVGLAVVAACFAPAGASEPGQPLDASDWVIVEPGLSVQTGLPFPCQEDASNPDPGCQRFGGSSLLLNGDVISIRETQLTFNGECGCGQNLYRQEVVALSEAGTERVLAYVMTRCNLGVPEFLDFIILNGASGRFDPIKGRIVIGANIFGQTLQYNGPGDCVPTAVYHGYSKLYINGFATMFDVLQTFVPDPNTIGFRVPYMPEGFQYADYFDTYYGSLAAVGDWNEAQPLQCGYPASAPSFDDYLTVEDTLSPPPPGGGYYYVTAATYQGQTRYGRRSTGGVLTGRDPAVLSGCGR